MNCPNCSTEMRCLFVSTYCPRCDKREGDEKKAAREAVAGRGRFVWRGGEVLPVYDLDERWPAGTDFVSRTRGGITYRFGSYASDSETHWQTEDGVCGIIPKSINVFRVQAGGRPL